MSELEFAAPDFDPIKEVKFRGKNINDMDRRELIEALCQALREVHALKRERS